MGFTVGFANTRRQWGFSLVELSVAAAIYSMGLGSVSLMLLLAMQGTASARHETVAAMHLASLAETIAMSSDAVGHLVYPLDADACPVGANCSEEAMAAANLGAWRQRVANGLPGGEGWYCRDSTPDDGARGDAACDGGGAPVAKVFWQTPAESGETPESHRVVTPLPLP